MWHLSGCHFCPGESWEEEWRWQSAAGTGVGHALQSLCSGGPWLHTARDTGLPLTSAWPYEHSTVEKAVECSAQDLALLQESLPQVGWPGRQTGQCVHRCLINGFEICSGLQQVKPKEEVSTPGLAASLSSRGCRLSPRSFLKGSL